jgi:hypothetical protein
MGTKIRESAAYVYTARRVIEQTGAEAPKSPSPGGKVIEHFTVPIFWKQRRKR